jgi:hypothetical protein
MVSKILRFGMWLVALAAGTAAWAGPLPFACVRDTEEDPAQIRLLFERVDRLAVRALQDSGARFYFADRGFIPVGEFVLWANFRDGREDAAPLAVTAIRRLPPGSGDPDRAPYVVRTTRSAWFDRGSDVHSGYTPLNDVWLVRFSGCSIETVREVPELHYLVDYRTDGTR